MADQLLTLAIETKNNKLKKNLERMISSMDSFSLLTEAHRQNIDILIYELGSDVASEFQELQYRLETGSVGDVFLMSEDTERSVLLQAIKIGAKEFFNLPLKEEELKDSLEKYKKNVSEQGKKVPKKMGQIIDVVGSKGGVGTTTIAVNLAVNLAQKKEVESVALFDMNALFGEVPTFLDMAPSSHWVEIAKNISRVDITFLMNILLKHSSNLYVLPSPGYLNGRLRQVTEIMEHLLNIMRRTFDFIIIDGGLSYTETSLRGLQMADKILMVSILNIPCLSNTSKLLTSIKDLGLLVDDNVQIIMNRYIKNSAISIEEAEEGIQKKIFWTIPNEYNVTMSAINKGIPLYKAAPRAKVTKSLMELADSLMPQEVEKSKNTRRFLNLF